MRLFGFYLIIAPASNLNDKFMLMLALYAFEETTLTIDFCKTSFSEILKY